MTWTSDQEVRLAYCQDQLKQAQKKWSDRQELWIREVNHFNPLFTFTLTYPNAHAHIVLQKKRRRGRSRSRRDGPPSSSPSPCPTLSPPHLFLHPTSPSPPPFQPTKQSTPLTNPPRSLLDPQQVDHLLEQKRLHLKSQKPSKEPSLRLWKRTRSWKAPSRPPSAVDTTDGERERDEGEEEEEDDDGLALRKGGGRGPGVRRSESMPQAVLVRCPHSLTYSLLQPDIN